MFKDRSEAGQRLADEIVSVVNGRVVVAAIARNLGIIQPGSRVSPSIPARGVVLVFFAEKAEP